jgi:benzodiazapine receptor
MRFIIFSILNFGALALGALLMIEGPLENNWYQSLDKAPWTPPGWVFGFAWTTIMICYSIYMGLLWKNRKEQRKQIAVLFMFQWTLNVAWNPVFFHFHWMAIGLVVIAMLEFILVYKHLKHAKKDLLLTVLILPYILWLAVAFSLNAYAWCFA